MKITWHLLFGPVLFSAHVYGSSQLVGARLLTGVIIMIEVHDNDDS